MTTTMTLEGAIQARRRVAAGESITAVATDMGQPFLDVFRAVRGITFKALAHPAPIDAGGGRRGW